MLWVRLVDLWRTLASAQLSVAFTDALPLAACRVTIAKHTHLGAPWPQATSARPLNPAYH